MNAVTFRLKMHFLRGSLYLTARALKDYHDAPHFEIEPADEDDIPGMEVIVCYRIPGP